MRVPLACSRCGFGTDAVEWVWRCERCGGPLDFDGVPPAGLPAPSLGEPQTPLLAVDVDGVAITAKLEGALPTGSFKDRGSRTVVAALRAYGVARAAVDSSGNAGASLAAYCARAGIACDVYAPAAASPAKLAQAEAFGARVVRVEGSREDVAAAAQAAAGVAYASHAWTPWFLAGTASFAAELVDQLGRPPDALVVPLGAGTLLLGAARGFERLGGLQPRLYGAQAAACAPLAAAFAAGLDGPAPVEPAQTAAEGVRIAAPPRGAQALEAVRRTGGAVVAVEEAELWRAFDGLAAQGVLVEPTSAVAFAAAARLGLDRDALVVVPATATGLKAAGAIAEHVRGRSLPSRALT